MKRITAAVLLTAMLFCGLPALASDELKLSDDASDFVLVTDVVPDVILEIRYYSTKTYDDEGNLSSETENSEATTGSGVAHCRRYQAEYNWYGLMTQDGHVLTPPSYSDISAIGSDLYLCKTDCEHGFILNGKGQRVR